jgi:Fe-S cluster assembly protein SufD
MNQESNNSDFYLSEYKKQANNLAGNSLSWLKERRQQAIKNFAENGFPSPRDEEWCYTNVKPIERKQFMPLAKGESVVDEPLLNNYALSSTDTLVFIDGQFCAERSDQPQLPKGAIVENMASALESHSDLLEAKLGRALHDEGHGFLDFNSAFFSDGLFVFMPKNSTLSKPLQLLFISTKSEIAQLSTLRNLLVVEEGASLEWVETWVGDSGHCYLNATVTEVLAAENSAVKMTKLQAESDKAYHFGGTYVKQAHYSRFNHQSFSFGGALVRNDLHTGLREAADVNLDGLFLVSGRQHIDNHTRINHTQPHATSRELYKGILSDKARGVFQGRVVVQEGAQKTNSEMNNHNLLLSDNAEIDAKPQLEIYADDVKCAHGVTVGQLDNESVFFLESRGIEAERAKNMLTFAFANEQVEKIELPDLKLQVQEQLLKQFPQEGIEKEWL